MTNRQDEFKSSGGKNPAAAFVEWKSEKREFVFFDKDKQADVSIPLPFRFVVLKEFNTVKGFHYPSKSRIYANEVTDMSKETLKVKSYKGGHIAEGLWSDIKAQVDKAGGKYCKSIYVMSEKGKLINIAMKGACVSRWFDFTADNRSRMADEWVEVASFTEEKQGRVEYTVPTFKLSGSLSAADGNNADECFALLKKYVVSGGEQSEREKEQAELASEVKKEAVPF